MWWAIAGVVGLAVAERLVYWIGVGIVESGDWEPTAFDRDWP